MYQYEKGHLQRLRAYLAECMVLLRKDGSFPLKEAGKIAVYGGGVRGTIKGGTGSGEVNSRTFITVEEGLKEAGFTITTTDWLDAYEQAYAEAKKEFRNTIKKRAKDNHTNLIIEGMGAVMPAPEYDLPLDGEGDAAIYVLSRISGEGNDRKAEAGDVLLNASEQRDILALNEKYDKFMLVLNVGGPVDLTPVKEVKNILILSQLGVETGAALADVLLGKAVPSGKLTTTWTTWTDYCQIGNFGDWDDTYYKEGIHVGYRYFDAVGKKPLFPFGYGLSYTEFEISDEKIAADGERVTVSATVKNIGQYSGKETLQVYVSAPWGELDKPYQVLAGFAKTAELQAGVEEQVEVSFNLSEIASYDEERAAYILEKGKYLVRIGTSSAETKVCGAIELTETVVTEQLKNTCGTPDFADWKPEKPKEEVLPEGVAVLKMDAGAFVPKTCSYTYEHEIAEEIKAISDEKLAYVNIGAFGGGGLVSMIGNAAKSVAGAAGETTLQLADEGFKSLVMADGPAGVRLCKKYYRDKKGVHCVGVGVPESFLFFMPKPIAKILGKEKKVKKGVEVLEQYATAIPIGTAIAQSFNPAFAEICGDVVGAEMERFGVHLWLAPALNIHRSILCGRNFEYYSEDPLVSGIFAAAITAGVQKHPSCGVTIKHYAANNQETNRCFNNSHVSERAMREVYLKGFEIFVKKEKPCAVMSSYNLLNGVHTSERRDLAEDILRCEWGFDGVLMTDWVISGGVFGKAAKYAVPHAAKVAAAGGDLFMPGCKKDYKEILKGLQQGILSREQLEINATRVYRMANRLVK